MAFAGLSELQHSSEEIEGAQGIAPYLVGEFSGCSAMEEDLLMWRLVKWHTDKQTKKWDMNLLPVTSFWKKVDFEKTKLNNFVNNKWK